MNVADIIEIKIVKIVTYVFFLLHIIKNRNVFNAVLPYIFTHASRHTVSCIKGCANQTKGNLKSMLQFPRFCVLKIVFSQLLHCTLLWMFWKNMMWVCTIIVRLHFQFTLYLKKQFIVTYNNIRYHIIIQLINYDLRVVNRFIRH